jgi:curved DNA-binding protein CbpA
MSGSYYEILQVSKDADEKDIKKAYHKLARSHHPDKAKSDDEKARLEEEFALITKAYNALKDPEQRKSYDESLAKERERAVGSASGSGGDSSSAAAAPAKPAVPGKPASGPGSGSGGGSNSADMEKGRKDVAKRAFAQGIKLLQLKEYERAAEFFRTALKSDASEAIYHAKLAVALLHSRKNFNEAVVAARKASELDPYKIDYKLQLAELYQAIGSASMAEGIYEDVLKWDPENNIAKASLAAKRARENENPIVKFWKKMVGRGK